MTTAPTPWLDESRRRRAAAEADEIALRAGHRRRQSVPVHDFAPDDLVRIHGVPEAGLCGDDDDETRRPVSWALVFVWIGAVVLILFGFALGWIIGTLDMSAVLDLLSPTAVQAREAGWVALSEGL